MKPLFITFSDSFFTCKCWCHEGIIRAFIPIILLRLVIMRLQSLIWVVVSLRSSESEEVVRFHTLGWETWAGPVTAEWQRLKGSLSPRRGENQTRPIRWGYNPAVKSYWPIRANYGRSLKLLLCFQRGTAEQSLTKKKGKVTRGKEKTHGGKTWSEGGAGTLCRY